MILGSILNISFVNRCFLNNFATGPHGIVSAIINFLYVLMSMNLSLSTSKKVANLLKGMTDEQAEEKASARA